MVLDSERQREQLMSIIRSATITGTLEEVEFISSGVRNLLETVRGAEVQDAGEGKEGG